MAITGIMRPGFIQVRVLDMPASVEFYTKRIGLHQVSEGPDGRVYLKSADEFDHHSIVLRRADSAGIDVAAFKCLKDSDLDHYEKRVKDYGSRSITLKAGEQPGIGRRIGFTIPAGHRIELFAHSDQSDPKPRIHNPDVWDLEPHGMAARRFDHSLLYGPDIEKTLDFFEKALDFRCAERVNMPDGLLAIWLTCGMKAHDIAFVKHPEPEQAPPSRVRTRELERGRARGRHHHPLRHLGRHRPDPPRHHARSDDLFLRSVGQSMRNVRRRLHLLSGPADPHLGRDAGRQGDLLLRASAQRSVPVRRFVRRAGRASRTTALGVRAKGGGLRRKL